MSLRAGALACLAGVLAYLVAIAAANKVTIESNGMTTDIQQHEQTTQDQSEVVTTNIQQDEQTFQDQSEASVESIAKQLNQLYVNKVKVMKNISLLEATLVAQPSHVGRTPCKESKTQAVKWKAGFDCQCGDNSCASGKYCFKGWWPDEGKELALPRCRTKPFRCFKVTNQVCLKPGKGVAYFQDNAVAALLKNTKKPGDPVLKYTATNHGKCWDIVAYHRNKESLDKHNQATWNPWAAEWRNPNCVVGTGAIMPDWKPEAACTTDDCRKNCPDEE